VSPRQCAGRLIRWARTSRGRAWTGTLAALAAVALLGVVLTGRRHEFATALSSASLLVLLSATALQLLALLVRTEAWYACVGAAGGTTGRRMLYRASSWGCVGALANAQLGAAARITALRRSGRADAPKVSALIGAELPILVIEGGLAAIACFTLVGPLGLPWWAPLVALTLVGCVIGVLRHAAATNTREIFRGLAVLRPTGSAARVVGLILVAVFAQIARNWIVLQALGVEASVLDATALLIAMVALSQLPIGPSVGAAAALIVFAPDGVALVAAAGVLLTATGTAGALAFIAWSAADRVLFAPLGARRRRRRAAARQRGAVGQPASSRA
jgi:uncharacterized membrane protein YbhN (UPF0104 family)